MQDEPSGKLKQLMIDWPRCEREALMKAVVFPKKLKIDHSKLAAVMHRIASFHGQPDGCYETIATFMQLFKMSEDQVERAFTALRKLNLLLERDVPEWDPRSKRKRHPKWINFDELKRMVERQHDVKKEPAPKTNQPRTESEEPRTAKAGTPHGAAMNPAWEGEEPRTKMRHNNMIQETPPHQSESDWAGVEESLRVLGVLKAGEAMRSARQRGCSLEHCNELIAYYRKRLDAPDHGWQAPAYVLLRRFQSASPSLNVVDGWFGSSPRSSTLATQRESNLQRTREMLARIHAPQQERANGFSEADKLAIASFGR